VLLRVTKGGGRLDRPRAQDAGGRLSFGAPSYRGGAPNDLIVLAARSRTTISLALRLVAEAVVGGRVSVGVAAIAIIAAEAANEPSVAEAATEPSVTDAAMEASIAEAAVEASTAEAAVEASAAAMETPSPSPSAVSDSWGRRDRKTEGKDRQGSGNRSKERYMHDSLSNPCVRAEGSLER
jgi:hypothetical protein